MFFPLSSILLTASLYDLIGHQASKLSVKWVSPRQGNVTQKQKAPPRDT